MEKDIINKLIELSKELEKTPTREQFIKSSGYSKRRINNLFGSYNKLIEKANLKPNRVLEKIKINCKKCNKELLRQTNKLKNNNFCSLKCSSTFKYSNKKDRTTICKICSNSFIKSKDKHSNTCSILCFMEMGMQQRIMKDSIKRTGANRYDLLRQNAKAYSKYFYPLNCMICGYDKHYEVCHIKDLKDFTGNETIYEVNNKTNLIHLCPNHHWEFDHNLIDISIIRDAQKPYL